MKDNNIIGINAVSAGTECSYEGVNPAVVKGLSRYGIDVSVHEQRKLSEKDVDEADILVVMGEAQKEFMKKNYNIDVPYYNKVCSNIDEPLLDVEETPEVHNRSDEAAYIINTINYIHDTIPMFYKNMLKYKKN